MTTTMCGECKYFDEDIDGCRCAYKKEIAFAGNNACENFEKAGYGDKITFADFIQPDRYVIGYTCPYCGKHDYIRTDYFFLRRSVRCKHCGNTSTLIFSKRDTFQEDYEEDE